MMTARVVTPDVETAPMLDIGTGANGWRRGIPIAGGRFEGRIPGAIPPGGADRNLARTLRIGHPRARNTLRTGGHPIRLTGEGGPAGDPETMDPVLKARPFDRPAWYARRRPVSEPAAPVPARPSARVCPGGLRVPEGPRHE